jgi:hypothetical protein
MKGSMVAITSDWNRAKTFKLIPVEIACPYNECIYDPDAKVLAVLSKEKKQTVHMVPKLNEVGDLQTLKIGKRPNGKDYAEERKTMETFYEYYIENQEEIYLLIKHLCINADTFDYKKYLESPAAKSQGPSILTSI